MALLFEAKPCSRCGGSGEYSYCQTYGSRCFKCHGKGEVLTKRGLAAQEHFNSLCVKPASEIKVGDIICVNSVTLDGGFFKYFAEVIEVSAPHVYGSSTVDGVKKDTVGIDITSDSKKFGRCKHTTSGKSDFRLAQSKEEKIEKREAALEYQANLTKAGTPRKRKVKAAGNAAQIK